MNLNEIPTPRTDAVVEHVDQMFNGKYWDMISIVRPKFARTLERENHLLREAAETLRLLHDYQNGPPLYKYEKPWGEAMQRAKKVLEQLGI